MRYRIFGSTGLRVSTMALGTGNFGTGWGYGSERDEAIQIFDAYRDAGGNFIDTADQYQFGQSETMLGEFIASSRDDILLASKFSIGADPQSSLHLTGNSRKAMTQACDASLKRLKTDRIDLLWVHFPDGVTPTAEIARGLDDLIAGGKILYAGLSNFPAWRVATAVTMAEMRGWHAVSALQIEYSLVARDPERELLPMAAGFGLGVVGWSPLGGGMLTGKYRDGQTGRLQGLGAVIHDENSARKTSTIDAVLAVAAEVGCPPGQVAVAWVLAKGVLPIIGPRTPAQLADYLAASEIRLTQGQIALLDAASATQFISPESGVADRLNAGKASLVDPTGRPLH
jgi:aryl-alcohol dehydrogenase-like predicted oxidoreductase